MKFSSLLVVALVGFVAASPTNPTPKPITSTKTITKTRTVHHTSKITVTTTVTATPTTPACPDQNVTADYDDLIQNDPIPATYKGLIYENFYVDEFDGFIKPTSGKNMLISYDSNIARVIKPAKGTFDLYTMDVACSSGFPQASCEIVVQGFTKAGLANQATYFYNALDSTTPQPFPMSTMPFKQWKDLTEIRILSARLTDRAPDDPFTPGFVIDDLRYNLKGACSDSCSAK